MVTAFKILGIAVATVAVFMGVMAIGFAVTSGSVWVMAFIPLGFAVAGSVCIVGVFTTGVLDD